MAFLKPEEDGLSLHFVNILTDDMNREFHSWLGVNLHSDFIDCITTLGRLPPTKTEDLIRDLKALREQEQTIKDQVESLKDRD